MEIITARKLQTLNTENQRLFEELLPELVKKLIINSCETDELCIPHGGDIWAPGFDGLIQNSKKTDYVDEGYSVWEFGTNANVLQKINEDYDKRTRDSLGVEKKETVFYLIVPRIWTYKTPITKWENSHNDWKKTKVYEASRLCDWINSEPAVAAWLLEKYYNQPANFHTTANAWTLFSQKTNPPMAESLFLADRKEKLDSFYNLLQSDIIRVKAETFVEAQGFVLAALLKRTSLAEKSIVVNDENTFRLVNSFVKNKLIMLNYPCGHDLTTTNGNHFVVCYNKEDTGIHDCVLLEPLTKYHYIRAFRDMGISDRDAHDLYAFSHGNLRAMTRRIPGAISDKKPEWATTPDIDSLSPLLFMRKINRTAALDRKLVELLTRNTFDVVEEKFQELIRLEDSPIKVVENYYILVNYEETWDTLGYKINGKQYAQLTETIFHVLDSIEQTGIFEGYTPSPYGRLSVFHTLLENYIYFSLDNPESEELPRMAQKVLEYTYKPLASILCIQNLSLLAEVSPQTVIDFLMSDMRSDSSIVCSLFDNRENDDSYLNILFALDELTHHPESVVKACRMLFQLCQKDYTFKTSNSPEESLINALCFINTSVALSIEKKAELIKRLFKQDSEHMSNIIIQIAEKDSCCISERRGRKNKKQHEDISIAEYYQAIEDISSDAFYKAIEGNDSKRIIQFLDMYYRYTPSFILQAAPSVKKEGFSLTDLYEMNYRIRELKYEIQRYRMKKDASYIKPLNAWIDATSDDKCPFHWLFHKFHRCPDDRLIAGDEDYITRDRKKTEIRSETLQYIISSQGIDGVYSIIEFMEDIHLWGFLIADNIPVEYMKLVALRLLEKDKIFILSGLLDQADKSIFAVVNNTLPHDKKERLYVCMNRIDIDELLIEEEDKKLYWQRKTMFKYDEMAYNRLLQYYPDGLLRYCNDTIMNDPTNHMDMVFEILNALLVHKEDHQSLGHLENHELIHILTTIDKVYYTEEWGRISKDLFVEGIISKLTEGGSRYFIYHPNDLLAYIDANKRYKYFFSDYFLLPSCVYKEPDKLNAFAKSLIDAGQASLLGIILGLSILGTDGFFPHDTIRDLLEEIDNEKVDTHIIVTYHNKQNAHFVTDGNEFKEQAQKFYDAADRLDISYPHTANILRGIGEDYKRESKHDYLYSEIGDI